MTVYLVCPQQNRTALGAAYLNEKVRGKRDRDVDEAIGVMVPNFDGTKLMTGTSRMSDALRRAFAGRKPPWLEIHESHDALIASGWRYPAALP